MKLLLGSLVTVTVFGFHTLAFAEEWTGRLYDITPNRPGITEEFCKSHVLDEFTSDGKTIHKEVVAKNGVKSTSASSITKQSGGVYFRHGMVTFSGKTDGKEWKEKVYVFGQSLSATGAEQGMWYTKDCKGFYRQNPA